MDLQYVPFNGEEASAKVAIGLMEQIVDSGIAGSSVSYSGLRCCYVLRLTKHAELFI